jgi:type I restriction enzyme S subunit
MVNGWAMSKLEDIVEIMDYKRIPINLTERVKRKQGKHKLYPYYGATGKVDYIDGYLFDGEYVLLGEDGVPFLDPLKNKAYIVNGKFWANNHVHILKGYISNKYLCFYLNYYDYTGHVTGTTRLKLNQSSMKSIYVKVPPLNEQNRIVEKIEELFSELDKAAEELQKVREQLKIYRQSVLKAAFEGKLTEDWRKNHNNYFHELKDLFSKIAKEVFANNGKKSNMRKNNNFVEETKYFSPIPKKWTWVKTRNISYDIQYGYTKSASKNPTGCKFLRITDIQNNEVAWEEVPYCNINNKDKKKYLLKEGDILFARTGATVGKSYLIKRDSPESIFASYLIRLKLSLFVNKLYVYYFFKSPLYWKQIKAGQVGTGQPNFNGTKLGNLLIPVCIIKEQEQIVQEIESRLSVCDKIEESVESGLIKIEHLRQSILKKAFEGKLVPQDPDDLPAEELLKQIKIEKEKIQNNSKKKVKR